jgi:hypothetical protein
MTQLLEIKSLLIEIYKKYDKLINPIGKFIISLIIITKLNTFFGYSPIFAKLGVNMAIAALAAFLPSSWFLMLLIVVVSAQLFSVSIEATIIIFVAMLVVYFLFARLQPKHAYLIMLVPLFYSLKIVYVLPIFAGLFLGISSIVPLAVGVAVYRFASYLPGILDNNIQGTTLFESPDIMINMYKYLSNVLLNDKVLVLTIAVFSITVIIMFFVKKLEIDYIWYITIGVGVVTMILTFIIGNVALNANIGIGGVFVGTIIGGLIVAGFQFFKFSLDYKRAEKLQFEDDDYYYYVRTIPKVKATMPQKEVKKIK